MSESQREKLRPIIEEKALHWGVGIVEHDEIDRINILNASFLAMHRALDQLGGRPQELLIDGNRFKPYQDLRHHCMIKGDGRFLSIAAASILAKTHRDEIMARLHNTHPHYAWDRNKGYPTKAHREGIRVHGASPFHRRSFQLLPKQLELEF